MIEKLMGDTPITRIGTIEYKIGDEVGLKVLRYPYPDSYLASVEDFIKEGNIELVKLRFR